MTSETNLLGQLERQLPDLNKSETKVAQAILQNPEEATRSSIDLASLAGVMNPREPRKKFAPPVFPTSS